MFLQSLNNQATNNTIKKTSGEYWMAGLEGYDNQYPLQIPEEGGRKETVNVCE